MAVILMMTVTIWPLHTYAKTAYQQALQLIEQERIPEARRALQSELRVGPGNVEARYDLAVLLEDIGQQADAQSLYEKNLSFYWHLPSLINLAALLQRSGKTEQVRQWLEKATENIRHEATPWYLLAAISEKKGHIRKAVTQYKKALQADPLNGFAWLRFAEFQSHRQLADKGIKFAEKAMRLLPDCAPCWRSYGNIMRATGQRNKALAAYQRSLAIRPDSQTRQQLINVLRQLGQTDRAERMQQALNAWRKHHPGQKKTNNSNRQHHSRSVPDDS